jgi:DNA-binding CsgD family transcriptional regulator
VPVDSASATTCTTPADLLRDVAAAATRPYDALPLVVEAADAVDRTPAPSLLPDTPHALGALLAVLAGDASTADRLLGRALHGPPGVRRTRHVLLRAWVGLRSGRYDEAVAVTRDGVGGPLPGMREELLLACVAAGLARRSGDVAALREAWATAEPLLVRRAADLWQLEQVEELAVAGARLRQEHRTEPVLAILEEALDGLGRPAAWEAAMAWLRLQCAVVREDVIAAEEATERLDRAAPAAPPPGRPPDGLHRARAQAAAARCWTRALHGEVDADAVVDASALLLAAGLPWEASRLAGEAAIRSVDPAVARRLLERARELAGGTPSDRGSVPAVVLSERERAVAELVRAGRTHREIGAQLYLSPKTVEHHVARMRSKLGAATRAEFLAALAHVMDGTAGARST